MADNRWRRPRSPSDAGLTTAGAMESSFGDHEVMQAPKPKWGGAPDCSGQATQAHDRWRTWSAAEAHPSSHQLQQANAERRRPPTKMRSDAKMRSATKMCSATDMCSATKMLQWPTVAPLPNLLRYQICSAARSAPLPTQKKGTVQSLMLFTFIL